MSRQGKAEASQGQESIARLWAVTAEHVLLDCDLKIKTERLKQRWQILNIEQKTDFTEWDYTPFDKQNHSTETGRLQFNLLVSTSTCCLVAAALSLTWDQLCNYYRSVIMVFVLVRWRQDCSEDCKSVKHFRLWRQRKDDTFWHGVLVFRRIILPALTGQL